MAWLIYSLELNRPNAQRNRGSNPPSRTCVVKIGKIIQFFKISSVGISLIEIYLLIRWIESL